MDLVRQASWTERGATCSRKKSPTAPTYRPDPDAGKGETLSQTPLAEGRHGKDLEAWITLPALGRFRRTGQ